jgi:L-rhamnose mutarotase
MERHGMMIKVRPEKLEEYKKLHADCWPGVLKMIKECNLGRYSIYYRDGYLFTYLEYTGNDFDADMRKMYADDTTREWLKHTDPCQQKLDTASPDEWWSPMEEVFHLD